MKAMRSAAAPRKVFPTHPCGLEISQHKEMLKMKIDPAMLMKTQAMMTKCPPKMQFFCRKIRPMSNNLPKSTGVFSRKWGNGAVIGSLTAKNFPLHHSIFGNETGGACLHGPAV
jgi:hypothetical protein